MKLQRVAWVFILLVGQLLFIGQGKAISWQSTVSTSVSTEYETNPTMSPTPERGVWRALFDPGYTLTGRTDENEISTGLVLQMVRSSNKTLTPDRDNPSAFLNWLHSSQTGEYGLYTRYAKEPTRDTAGADATGRVPIDSTRTSRTLSGNWNKELSERSSLSMNGEYEVVTYTGGGDYFDYSIRSGGLRFNYILSEQGSTFFGVSGNKYMPTGGEISSSLVDAILGLDWKTEYMDWSMQVGVSRVGGGKSDRSGSITAHYTGQQTQLILSAGRMIRPSGLGGFLKSDYVRGNWIYTLSEFTSMGVNLERQKNLSPTMADDITDTTSGLWIDHNLTDLWTMRTYYRHLTTRTGAAERISTNIAGFTFTYLNPDF